MSSIAVSTRLEPWLTFLRAHAAIMRELSSDLQREHGLTINDYEVLLHLARAPERRLRRVDLADRLLLTASGITRLLDGLQRGGYVDKASCDTDARVTYAVLTDEGLEKLRAAADTHVGGIRERFESRFTDDELDTLATLLARLPMAGDDGSCSVD
jgi:DNA-binding MarR family transcriptional regulator